MAHILVVDDEESINKLVCRNLKLVGHDCDQAFDGKEALQKIQMQTYDLIILDVMLPYISGFDEIHRGYSGNLSDSKSKSR